MTETHFNVLIWVWIAIAIVTFLSLSIFKIVAPYGRHSSNKWGKTMANHWGWFWMELPALLVCPLLIIFGPREKDTLTYILLIMWTLHYFNRTVIFPFRIKTKGKRIPLVIVLSALFFNGMNGFINGYFLGFIAPHDRTLDVLVYIGVALYIIGMYINTQTDKRLIALREEGEGYKIPKGWLFKYISCPNHFGEIIEWAGFAIAAWSLPALSFAIWSFCNLAPRAFNHHDWYKSHFEDYPSNRKALIPFIW